MTQYHIYKITDDYDHELDAAVQRWSLHDKLSCRQKAKEKAKEIAKSDAEYTRIEVVKCAANSNQVVWSTKQNTKRFRDLFKF